MFCQLVQLMLMMLLCKIGDAVDAHTAGRSRGSSVMVLVGWTVLVKPFLFEGRTPVDRGGSGG